MLACRSGRSRSTSRTTGRRRLAPRSTPSTPRAELDEALLEQYHGTISLPFQAGDNRKVAVKIVDDRGIESLKVISLDDVA